jgi:peptide/nickel transport system ATP-binding protein
MQKVLDVKDVSFGYTNNNILFKNLSFSVKKGEIKAIVGESGAGKSTLFEIILGGIKPTNGHIERSTVSQVFQDPYSSFHPSYPIIEQIKDVASLNELDSLLNLINLKYDLLLKLPHKLSGGQLQRASIVRALLMNPDLLLLDEPTSALDNIIQLEVMKSLIANLKYMGILLITHDIDLALWCADEIIQI